jgi:hypothetical protein
LLLSPIREVTFPVPFLKIQSRIPGSADDTGDPGLPPL